MEEFEVGIHDYISFSFIAISLFVMGWMSWRYAVVR